MESTKEKILKSALDLFSKKGIEGVTTREIASAVGVTQGALYKHFTNKQAIFEAIKEEMDAYARKFGKVVGRAEMEQDGYRMITFEELADDTMDTFAFWTQSPLAAQFRKLVTIEQFKDETISALFEQYVGNEAIANIADRFKEIGLTSVYEIATPELLALEFYGPIFLLMFLYDHANDKQGIETLANDHSRLFIQMLNDQENATLNLSIKICISCGMPMKTKLDFAGGDEQKDYCVYCSHEDGSMQNFNERKNALTEFIARMKHVDRAAAMHEAEEQMKKLPAWKDHFVC